MKIQLSYLLYSPLNGILNVLPRSQKQPLNPAHQVFKNLIGFTHIFFSELEAPLASWYILNGPMSSSRMENPKLWNKYQALPLDSFISKHCIDFVLDGLASKTCRPVLQEFVLSAKQFLLHINDLL